jgi:superfamily II DNA or RNA helicase
METKDSKALSNQLDFHGTWRPYQAEVLKDLEHHLADNKLHIIAAPGAGKTVLGVELLRRLDQNAIILTPRISIQRQWAATINNLFLNPSANNDLTSVDINSPAPITILTYQSLKQLFQSKEKNGTLNGLLAFSPKTLVLDEAHHLTESWAQDVKKLYEKVQANRTISLTATPPYEAKGKQMASYFNLCGDIDLEISIPELVSNSNLCPHQDYIYLNTPTNDENNAIERIHERQKNFLNWIVTNKEQEDLLTFYVRCLSADWKTPQFSDPAFRLSIAAFSKYKGQELSWINNSCPPLHKIKIPDFSIKELQSYLTGILKEENITKTKDERTLKKTVLTLRKRLKEGGFLDGSNINIVDPVELRSLLSLSGNKINSIANIATAEFNNLDNHLRLLLLVDRIGDDFLLEPDPDSSPQIAHAVPAFFRFSEIFEHKNISVAMLTGRLIILPKTVLPELEKWCSDNNKCCPTSEFQPLENRPGYIYVQGSGSFFPDLISGCTALLDTGKLQVVVGTGSLLGEGWDCPSINSLILASQIGSFVSSNQMRGRAIRIDKNNPSKVANIWHLATIPDKEQTGGYEYNILERRFKTFVGVANDEDIITDGTERVGLAQGRTNEIDEHNKGTLALAENRTELAGRWEYILDNAEYKRLNFRVQSEALPGKKRLLLANIVLSKGWFYKVFNPITAAIDLCRMDIDTLVIKRICRVITQSLYKEGLIRTKKNAVKFSTNKNKQLIISCGDRKDNSVIQSAISDLYSINEDTRYLISFKIPLALPIFFGVPNILGSKKQVAEVFQNQIAKAIGPTELIYTRSGEGHMILARLMSENIATPTHQGIKISRIWS